MNFRNLKLAHKQILAFTIVLIIMAGVNAYLLGRLDDFRSDLERVATNWLPRVIAISDVNTSTSDLRMLQLQYVFLPDDSLQQAGLMIELIDRIEYNRDIYEALKAESEAAHEYTDEERQLYESFDRNWEAYQHLCLNFMTMLRSGATEEAAALLSGEAQIAFSAFSTDLTSLVRVTRIKAVDAADQAESLFVATRKLSLILIITTLVVIAIISYVMVRLITRPIESLEAAAGEVARGDLNVHLVVHGNDEIGQLATCFNRMINSLREARAKTESQREKIVQKNRELENALAELRETQTQLVQSEKMASLGQLVAGVAHEINTPVGAIGSMHNTQMRALVKLHKLVETSAMPPGPDRDQVEKYIGMMEDAGKVIESGSSRVANIVRRLRSFARLDEAELKKTDLHEGLEDTLVLINHEIKHGITIHRNYGEIPEIPCYSSQLNQVFLNILINARQAIGGKGDITITTFQKNDRVHLIFEDSGRGISKENLARVFDPGFTTKGVGTGTGLGLSICYQIISDHHGQITVESEPDRGTRFTIILPTNLDELA